MQVNLKLESLSSIERTSNSPINEVANMAEIIQVENIANPIIQTANKYYYNPVENRPIPSIDPSEIKDYNELKVLIEADNLDGLKDSTLLKKYGVNHHFIHENVTLLHLAYFYNKPKIVDWLLENGAFDNACCSMGVPPIACAPLEYNDSRVRVVNELAKRYFDQCGGNLNRDPHVLFDVISNFIQEKGWRYCDGHERYDFDKKTTRYRDDDRVLFFGLPSLIYNVNCGSLSNLFLTLAKKVGIEAEGVFYVNYKSISPEQKNERDILGDFKMFDGSRSGAFKFDAHNVIFSDGYYFDLTTKSKYKDHNDVLLVPTTNTRRTYGVLEIISK